MKARSPAAGSLDRRIGLLTPTETRDAYGALVPDWALAATVWGSLRPLSARELQVYGTTVSSALVKITLRYRGDIDETYCVTCDGRRMNVRGVTEIGRREALELLCEVVDEQP